MQGIALEGELTSQVSDLRDATECPRRSSVSIDCVI